MNRYLLPLIIILTVAIAGGSYWYYQNRIAPVRKETAVIATVGDEKLYRHDLEVAREYYPPATNGGQMTDQDITQKLVDDSITLQAAQKNGWIKLDNNVYNNPFKNYPQRVSLVKQVQDMVNNQNQGSIKVGIVTIFFYNFPKIPSIGIDKAKSIISSKITSIYTQVKSGKMNIQQAADTIRQDSSLQEIDPAYKSNAYHEYTIPDSKHDITFDSTFDKELWSLSIGQVSSLHLAIDSSSTPGKPFESAYMFGQVIAKASSSNTSFNTWLQNQKGAYNVKIY